MNGHHASYAVIGYVLLTAVAVLAVYYRWSRRKLLGAVANMDGPLSLPLIGHAYLLFKFTSEAAIFRNFTEMAKLYTSPVCFNIGPLVHVALFTPEHLQIVLNSPYCTSKPRQYGFFGVNRGLFSAPGPLWKSQRRNLNLSFGSAILSSFLGIFNEKSSILVENLAAYVGQPQRDISHDIAKCFLDTIYSTAFGLNFDLQRTAKGDHILQIQEEFIDLVTRRIFSPMKYPEFLFRMTKDYKKQQEVLEFMRDTSLKVMETKIGDDGLASKLDVNSNVEENLDGKSPQIFLDSLMDLARKSEDFTIKDIIDNLITIIVAGNDTTATTLSNLMLMLAIHQDVQERVYQEIMQACPAKDQFVSQEDVGMLTYTEMVCKETMRLFPIAPLIGRVTTQEIKLDDKNSIPANATIVAVIYQVHRDPSIWGPEPEKFNPDHFLPENCSRRHPYAYVPFSAGPRNCIGLRYAWISMKILIAHVLRRYRLRTTLTMESIKMKDSIILRISNGCLVTLEERM
ncbi:hypothetical protein quinque_001182 [Culex quinquefasciatus]